MYRPQTSPKHSRRPTEQSRTRSNIDNSSFAFPTSDQSTFLSGVDFTPRHPRTRTRTGPSSQKSKWYDNSFPTLRFSGTSSLEDPPPTPADASSIADFPPLNFSVVVAAPISGVETLDALVDGMNGMAGASMEDFFSRNASTSSRFPHNPLYQPPLPTPPPGVVLGKGKGKRREKIVTSDDDDDDDTPTTKSSRSHPRYRYSPVSSFPRKASTSTITVDSTLSDNVTSPLTDFNDHTPPTTVQPPERPRTVIPSISEIIRNHAHALERTRPPSVHTSGYGHVNGASLAGQEEEESEPEPLTPNEEAEFLSRSSMDSIEHEVRRTLNNQKNSQVTALPYTAPRALPLTSVPSNTSDASSVRFGVRAAASDTCAHSSSTPSAHMSQQSFDSIQFSVSPTSTSQTIAEYLRSARLTTLLKLTRYPHASLDHPLTVSLADMGDPNGFPLVVFLGLGCVRHIMGLYDEMADCLGLRLIAIDR